MARIRITTHPPQPVVQIMTSRVPVVSARATIGEIEKILLKKTRFFDSINYVYVVNQEKMLVGVISIKEIFRRQKGTLVARVMIKNIFSLQPDDSQEEAALIALKRNLKAVPVVDKNGYFLGAVLNDDILRILYREVSVDMLKLAGINRQAANLDIAFKGSIGSALKNRLPWLVIGLLGGLFASFVVDKFEFVLERHILLASFIPVVVYMSGATVTQMQAFVIRDFAWNRKIDWRSYFVKQLAVLLLIAVTSAGLIWAGSFFVYREMVLSTVLALAIFVTISSSIFAGLLIPYIFSRLKYDPANASGPIATIVQDVASVFVYLLIASIIL
ncbi:MAG TPA: CBS domain-containing protein [bacterium]|nr:CBS domain-containing protein [bacterium]HNS34389.1 CBS domain-containing protein [bacterium]HPN81174.1 CBS domain-containing protein [bacterium]HPW39209.1 CBS domain-containing protein [bacterium]